jgi:flagellin
MKCYFLREGAQIMNGLSMTNMSSYHDHMKFIRYSMATRINKAGNDPAGLAISEKMRGQFRGDDVAVRNMQDSQSLSRTAEGALDQSHSVLQRMRELSIQANNGMLTESDRGHIQKEFSGLQDTLAAIGRDTQFNTKPLLDGSFSKQLTTTNANGAVLEMNINSALSSQLGDLKTGLTINDVDLRKGSAQALSVIDGAIAQISETRGSLGMTDNRFGHGITVATTKSYQLKASESRIRDADMAKNAIELQKFQTMQDAYFMTQRMGIGMSGMYLNLLM